MMNEKKAQGLSMTTIIVAALALIVLVVLATIFMTRMADLRQSSESCENNGGVCVDRGTCGIVDYEKKAAYPCFIKENGRNIVDQTKECCIRT